MSNATFTSNPQRMLLAWSIVGIMLLVLAIYAWPGLYFYGSASSDVYRVNKITGTKQWSTEHGWMSQKEIQEQAERDLEAEVASLERELQTRAANNEIRSARTSGAMLSLTTTHGPEEMMVIDQRTRDRYVKALRRGGVQTALEYVDYK